MNENYNGIKFCIFFQYWKKLNGCKRQIVRLVEVKNDLAEATNLIRNRISTYKHDLNSYYIVEYCYDREFPERVKEYKLTRQ
jgi:phage anti-repressor protein